MKRKQTPLVLSIIIIIAFVFFSHIVSSGTLASFDFQATISIQNLIPKSLDTLLSFFSILGSFEVLTTILIFILFLRRKLNGLIVFGLYSLGMIIETIGKISIFHPGPPHRFFRYDLNFLFPSSFVQTKFSYPSGHAMRFSFLIIFFIYLVMTSQKLNQEKKLLITVLLIILLLIMIVSRVSLGEHWSTDVIAGVLLGIGLGFLSIVFSRHEKKAN